MFNQFNGHFPVLFDDGVKWLVRLRQMTNYSATGEIQSLVTTSEAQTMRVLHSAGLLVPDAWTVAEDERLELSPGTFISMPHRNSPIEKVRNTTISSSSVPRGSRGRN